MRNRRSGSRETENADLFSTSLIFGNVGGGVSNLYIHLSVPGSLNLSLVVFHRDVSVILI